MKSLFLRVFVSLWLTMTLILGVFAVVHALTFPAEFAARYRKSNARFTELRASAVLDCRHAGGTSCDDVLEPVDDRDARIAIYREGVLIAGSEISGVEEVELLARTTGAVSGRSEDARELVAVAIDREDGRFVAASVQRKPSVWLRFLVPETLAWRLCAIVAVTGIVSVLLARYLSRPIRTLRTATQRLAGGDLSVRVAPQLAGADSETASLGVDMDAMAERIEALLEGQRRLLRDVSHELRSPLARLNIALELLRRKSPAEVSQLLDRIERESTRLDGMIGELLTLSRLEAGTEIEKTEVDLSELVRGISDDVGFEADKKQARVELLRIDDISIDANRELLHRTIENVMRNAVRFTEPGTAIEVELAQKDGMVELSVRDHGPGVPDGSLEAIFQPFYRVEDHRARKEGGAGIGLAIADRAARIHGGSISAKNEKSGGLRVELTLPAQRSPA
jgi:two-component system OmpR family sensor kinase